MFIMDRVGETAGNARKRCEKGLVKRERELVCVSEKERERENVEERKREGEREVPAQKVGYVDDHANNSRKDKGDDYR